MSATEVSSLHGLRVLRFGGQLPGRLGGQPHRSEGGWVVGEEEGEELLEKLVVVGGRSQFLLRRICPMISMFLQSWL